jgi:hypothetical protein
VTMLGLKRREEDPEETDLKALDAQDRLRSIIEQQPACLAEVAADGQVLAMNSAQVALMGAHGGGRGYHDLVSLTDRERVADFIRQVTEGESGSLEYLIVVPGGGACDVVTDAVPLDRGSDHGVVAVMATRDLTAYRGLEDQIRKQAEDHVETCAGLKAQLQATEERERALVAQREVERERVGQALERARVQLLELKGLRNQVAGLGGGVPAGLAVAPADSRKHAAAGA